MAVDNLPCELPRDSSRDFGRVMVDKIIPCLVGDDPQNVIGNASETNLNGELTEKFSYLQAYADSAK